jgi:4-hydroxybenzoyl-CoA reductase subunit beta
VLRLNRFAYIAPPTLDEALGLLQEHGPDAMLMAGGTDLLVNIKHRLCTPEIVVGIRQLPELSGKYLSTNGWLNLGASTRLSSLETDGEIASRYPALAEAARLISAPQVRTVATLGGNICLDTRCNYYNQSQEWRRAIGFCMKKDSPVCRVAPGGDRCWAVASADTVPVLICLRAEATVADHAGVRRVPVESLYQDDGLVPLTLQFGEVITQIHIPAPGSWETVYAKFRLRQSFDFPLVGVAVSLARDDAGEVTDARIALTAVASLPERAPAAEAALIGKQVSEDSIAAAGQAVFRQAKPMDNTAGSIFHRKRMARVLLERSLRQISGNGAAVERMA